MSFSLIPQTVKQINTEFRTIQTQIPVPESILLLEKLFQIESRSMHGQLPIIWDKAEGCQVYDAWGNKWLDFTSTIFVANAGHGNQRIIDALQKALEKPLLHTYNYASSERIEYLDYLIAHTPKQFEKAFLLSAGTEAVEAALKLMRLYGQKQGKKKGGILSFEGNWHGRTVGAQSLSSNENQKSWMGYKDPNIHHLPFPYPWQQQVVENPRQFFRDSLKQLVDAKNINPEQDLCGIMMETFQGWGAVFYPDEFVQEVRDFANEYGLLLVFDEMQSGFGRTGELFGYMHYGVEPDMICCGKGAASSLPLALVLGSEAIMDLPDIGSMSSTHSANPLACVAGKANFQALLEDGYIENSRQLGVVFQRQLQEIQKKYPNYIQTVLGKGLLAALVFIDPQGNLLTGLCNKICELAMQRGLLLVHTGRESIKLAPPLCINESALNEGIDVLDSCIKESIQESE